MTKYMRAEYAEAVQFTGSLESVLELSSMTTVKVLLSSSMIATVDVYVSPTTDVDDGYRTMAVGSWLVEYGTTITIWSDEQFRKEFVSV